VARRQFFGLSAAPAPERRRGRGRCSRVHPRRMPGVRGRRRCAKAAFTERFGIERRCREDSARVYSSRGAIARPALRF
jgi:hypothetical protein